MENSAQCSLFQVAEIQLSYKPAFKSADRPTVTGSKHVYDLFFNNWDLDKINFIEQFKILLLNRASKALGIYEVSSGGITGTIADPRLIFAAALKSNSTAILLAHNHPSGNLKPSDADIVLTRKISEGGKLLEIAVLDHLIITDEGYFSFADEGLL